MWYICAVCRGMCSVFEYGVCAMLCVYGMFVICRYKHGCNVWVVYMYCVHVMCCVGVCVRSRGVCVVYMCYVGGMCDVLECGVWYVCDIWVHVWV